MPLLQAIIFLLLITLNADSPAPEMVVSQFRMVRGILTEVRHDLIKNRCYRVLHLKECEVEFR